MSNLYKVTYKRTGYQTKSRTETNMIFADSPETINKYRLGGFQRDSIDILNVEFVRERRTIECDADIERNELSFTINVDDHINGTLQHNKTLEEILLSQSAKEETDIEEVLESLGYIERVHDNTYNYCSDFSDDLDFKVFTKSKDSDWVYDEDAVVLVWKHYGLDARAGYSFHGVYSPLPDEALLYFLAFHVRVEVMDKGATIGVADYDGDGAVHEALQDYTLQFYNETTREIIVVDKEGNEFLLDASHPCEWL